MTWYHWLGIAAGFVFHGVREVFAWRALRRDRREFDARMATMRERLDRGAGIQIKSASAQGEK